MRKKGKGRFTPQLPFLDDVRAPIPSQLWLSDDARTLVALLIDPEDYSNRELYLLGRNSASGKWPGYWMRTRPRTARCARLESFDAGLVPGAGARWSRTQTEWAGAAMAHVWRRIDEGDPYRGDPSQLMPKYPRYLRQRGRRGIQKVCASREDNPEALRPDCWVARDTRST